MVLLWLTLLMVVMGFALARTQMVYQVRTEILFDPSRKMAESLARYEILPTYESMLASRKYWHLWTTRAWQKWIDEQKAERENHST